MKDRAKSINFGGVCDDVITHDEAGGCSSVDQGGGKRRRTNVIATRCYFALEGA